MSIISHHDTNDDDHPKRIAASEEEFRQPLSNASSAAIKRWIAVSVCSPPSR